MQLRDHQAVLSKGDVFKVDPRLLKVDTGFNVRDLDSPLARPKLDELKEQIRGVGVESPLEVRLVGEDVFIVSGHRRHKVVMELIAEGEPITSVPAIAEPKAVNEEERVARLLTLNAGEPLSSLEKAELVRRLLGYGWDRAKIAKRFGVAAQTIANWEELLGAPQEVREAVRSGELAASSAVAMVKQDGDKATETLSRARTVASDRGKAKITPKSIRRTTEPPARPEPPRTQARVEGAISALLAAMDDGYSPEVAASSYIARDPREIERLRDWLAEFEDHLRAKAADRVDAGVSAEDIAAML